MNLAHYEFSAERSSLICQELGLSIERKPLIENHLNFFHNKKRTESLKDIITPKDKDDVIALKMISVITRCSGRTRIYPSLNFLLNYMLESNTKLDEIEKFN